MKAQSFLCSESIIIQYLCSTGYIVINEDNDRILDASNHPKKDLVWSQGFICNKRQLIKQTNLHDNACDNEILLRLYQIYGTKCVEQISGPFSWIIWDSTRKELTATRDRMGIHSLYYSFSGKSLLLANDIQGILNRGPSYQYNIRSIISQINCTVPEPGETYYTNINVIKPGYYITIKNKDITVQCYWSAELKPLLKLKDDNEYGEAYRNLLFQVVSEYVPNENFGITLSSGLDSTSIAAAIHNASPETSLTAFCWTAPELPIADESTYSSAVCRRFSIPSITIRADLHWPLNTIEGIKTKRCMPFYNFYNDTWEKTYQEVKAHNIQKLFLGVGGDSLFGGDVYSYPDLFLTFQWSELIRQIKFHLPRSPNKWNLHNIIRGMLLGPIIRTYLPSFLCHHSPKIVWLSKKYQDNGYHNEGKKYNNYLTLPGRYYRLRNIQSPVLQWVLESLNLESKSNQVQLRFPLLDHRLVEFSLSLPSTQTFRSFQRKIIVRNAMKGYLPDEIINRWNKIYPTSICHRGLREREQTKIWKLMTNMCLSDLGLVDEQRLRKVYQNYINKQHNDVSFFHTITIEDWLRRYF